MIIHYARGTEHAYDEDTRDLHYGKYDCPMAKFLYDQVMMDGDFGDDEFSWGGEGWTRYGRYLLSWDNQGFVYCDKFPTVAAAIADRDQWVKENSEPCDRCGEVLSPYDFYDDGCSDHECDGSGPLADSYVVVEGRAGVAWRVTEHFMARGTVEAHMVGNDRTKTLDDTTVRVIDPSEFCLDCGQVGCYWHRGE